MRRILGALVAFVLIGAGCSSDDAKDPSPTGAGVVEDLVPLIVADGSAVSRYMNGKSDTLHHFTEGDAALALSEPGGEGIVVQQRFDDRSNIVRIAGGKTETIAENAGLFDAASVDGTPTVVYGTCDSSTEAEPAGDIVLFDLASRKTHKLATACAPEYGVGRVSFGGGVFVASATSDLTEVFTFYEPDGKRVKHRPNPTDDLSYNEPPFLSEAVLSPDGSSLAYLEAPDISGVTGAEQKRSGDFNVVVVDEGSGKETARVKLPDPGTQYRRLDYDGRWLIVSEGEGSRVHVVDTDAEDPKEIAIGAEGVASIARS